MSIICKFSFSLSSLASIPFTGIKTLRSLTASNTFSLTNATNESKFTALPGGYRSYGDGAYFSIGNNATWWSSSSNTSYAAWSRAITLYNTTDIQVISNNKRYGISVRCIMD